MKKMKIEKQLIFADQVQQVNALKVSEHLNYRHEDDGIRAMGPLYIEGEYTGSDGVEKFREALEMDVLAPNHKLSDEPFSLKIEDYQAKANQDTIQVSITLAIQGLNDDKKEAATTVAKEVPMPNNTQNEIRQAEPVTEPQNSVLPLDAITVPKDEEQCEAADQENTETVVDDFNDLFADSDSTYTSYRIIVAKPNDTYASIADRCEVDEQQLRETNRNKEISAKTPVILPFQ